MPRQQQILLEQGLAVLKTCLEHQVGAGAVQAPSIGFPHLLLLAG